MFMASGAFMLVARAVSIPAWVVPRVFGKICSALGL